jgi:hypothetical protein
LKTATAAAGIGFGLFPENFDSDRFFTTSWAREELWQALLWNMNNLLPSSPHLGVLDRICTSVISMLFLK